MDWSSKVHVHFSEELIEHVEETKPSLRLYLKEKEQMLVMQPAFAYNDVEIQWGFFGDVIEPLNGVVKVVKRNEVAEQEYVNMLRTLHSDMQHNQERTFLLHACNIGTGQ
ncbi:MAG: SNF2 helicase associated domain-containing protein [Luteolibacter sp.]